MRDIQDNLGNEINDGGLVVDAYIFNWSNASLAVLSWKRTFIGSPLTSWLIDVSLFTMHDSGMSWLMNIFVIVHIICYVTALVVPSRNSSNSVSFVTYYYMGSRQLSVPSCSQQHVWKPCFVICRTNSLEFTVWWFASPNLKAHLITRHFRVLAD